MQAEPSSKITQIAMQARSLIRGARTAALSTLMVENGAPYGSLVLSATACNAAPILLLSGLAVHTRNLARDPRISLLYEASSGLEEPLTGARLSLIGSLQPVPDMDLAHCRGRFLARHSGAAAYIDFADFKLYRVQPDRAHLVAGFGQIDWIEAADLLLRPSQCGALADAEPGILAHMNTDHADSIALYAQNLLGLPGGAWKMTGCDPEGCDLQQGVIHARLPFASPAHTPAQIRQELVMLSRDARAKSSL